LWALTRQATVALNAWLAWLHDNIGIANFEVPGMNKCLYHHHL
jgi:hypothetical protein